MLLKKIILLMRIKEGNNIINENKWKIWISIKINKYILYKC